MSAVANSEDQEICFACEEPLLPGQLVLQDAEEGLMHRACCGPERDAFCNLETGEPLGPDEPLPEGFPYAPVTSQGPDAETRLRELEAELVETKEAFCTIVRESHRLLKRALGRADELLAANTREVERRRAAERKAAEAAKGWRPIETAPKDGSFVFLWMVHANAQFSSDPETDGWVAPVVAQWIEHNGGGWTWHGLCGCPTHWMPLPAAPGAHRG